MNPVRRLFIGFIVLISAATGYTAGRYQLRPVEEVSQPIAFNHKLHVTDAGLTCDTCHEHYKTSDHSGLPGLSTCMGCHEQAQTDSPEEKLIPQLAAAGREDVFRKLFRLPDHAFYSHRRHVAIAGIACETCHGAVAQSTEPPEAPLVRMTMGFCVSCHEQEGASVDCTRCHR